MENSENNEIKNTENEEKKASEDVQKKNDGNIVIPKEIKNELPKDWKFDFVKKNGGFMHGEWFITTHIPKLADTVSIESKKSILSRGQYGTMALAGAYIPSQTKALDIIDALSTLQVMCEFPKDFPHKDNLADADDDFVDELLAIFSDYQKWQEFFRSNIPNKH